MRPVTVATPTGATWSSNCIYYTPNTTDGVKYTTNAVGNLSYAAIDRSFIYEYDNTGNISKITDKTGATEKVSTYEYDGANQMNRENNPYSGQTVTYLYDKGGNIKAKNIYDYTTGSLDGLTPTVVNYTYGDAEWKDLLTSYNGQEITYDEIGNPKNYMGLRLSWKNGRQLAGVTNWGSTLSITSYQYNDAGIRTYKNASGTKTDYFLDGSTIIAQKTGDNTIWYYYDSDGTREAMEYNGNVYYYFYNAQGDVMGLYDNNAQIVALYAYDSWGKILSVTDKDGNAITDKTHVANVNPFRYRGYHYDEETGFYYLNSRYYDPETGRFINADGFVSTGQGIFSNNMFAYCENNPVNYADPTGRFCVAVMGGVAALLLAASVMTINTTSAATTSSEASSTKSYNSYLNALRNRESSNNYGAVNQYGYLGAYQMGKTALQDAGFKNSSGTWTKLANSYGVYSDADFLKISNAQDAAITEYNKKVCSYIKYYGLDSYVGTSYCGVPVTKSGLLASCHLVGVGTMRNALSTGVVVWDGNQVPASEYMSLFEGYDISEVW